MPWPRLENRTALSLPRTMSRPLPHTGVPVTPTAARAAQWPLPRPRQMPPCAGTLVVPQQGWESPPTPGCHSVTSAVTDRQAPARRTINYSHALFLNIDVKSKFPACPSPASPKGFSHHKEPHS